MIPVVSVAQMREIEAATAEAGVSYEQMMENAGAELASLLAHHTHGERHLLFLIGPGNNGGDGLVAARILRETQATEVTAYLVKPRDASDQVFTRAREAGVEVVLASNDKKHDRLRKLLDESDVLVDALLGIGARLPIEGAIAEILNEAGSYAKAQAAGRIQWRLQHEFRWRELHKPRSSEDQPLLIVAVDCPSGVDCDTGQADPLTLKAHQTLTFGAVKQGLLAFPAADYCGLLHVGRIGSPEEVLQTYADSLSMVERADVIQRIPARPSQSHKGTFGRAVIVAGSLNYPGAAALALEAACRCGAGLVTGAIPQPIYPILAAKLSDPTWLLLPSNMGAINEAALAVLLEEMGEAQALLVGPGLGRDEETGRFVRGLLVGETRPHRRGALGFVTSAAAESEVKAGTIPDHLVLDADALYHLADIEAWWKHLPPQTVLTPHPGEFERLTGIGRDEIAARRVELAQEYAEKWGCVVLLKGAYTVIAAPDGHTVINPHATAALARGGTGDVLAGIIVGLMAQGLAGFDAALCGAWIHGALVRRGRVGEAMMLASDMVSEVGKVIVGLQR